MAVLSSRRIRSVALLIAVALFAAATAAFADGFRIETKVFVGEKKEVVSETTTLFLDGVVYDFLKKPEQTAVYRKAVGDKPGQFILLNDQRGILTKVSTEEVAEVNKKLQKWASEQRDPFLQFAANPEFTEDFDNSNGQLKLVSHLETYKVDTMPSEHPDAMVEYRDFLDRYAQLNTLLTGGSFPPGPRMRLNAVLARRKVVPIKVELARTGEDPLRAEHAFTWRLSQDDHKRIDDVRSYLSSYQEVKNDEFLRQTASARLSK